MLRHDVQRRKASKPRNPRGRAWRSYSRVDPALAVLKQIEGRRLRSLDDCRLAWERSLDPLAVCVAVIMTPGLPAWLTDAVLALLHNPETLARAWRNRFDDSIDAQRAWQFVRARTTRGDTTADDLTWDKAAEVGEIFAAAAAARAGLPVERVGGDAIKKGYKHVRRGLESNPGRYYIPNDVPATAKRLEAAGGELLKLLQALLAKE